MTLLTLMYSYPPYVWSQYLFIYILVYKTIDALARLHLGLFEDDKQAFLLISLKISIYVKNEKLIGRNSFFTS